MQSSFPSNALDSRPRIVVRGKLHGNDGERRHCTETPRDIPSAEARESAVGARRHDPQEARQEEHRSAAARARLPVVGRQNRAVGGGDHPHHGHGLGVPVCRLRGDQGVLERGGAGAVRVPPPVPPGPPLRLNEAGADVPAIHARGAYGRHRRPAPGQRGPRGHLHHAHGLLQRRRRRLHGRLRAARGWSTSLPGPARPTWASTGAATAA